MQIRLPIVAIAGALLVSGGALPALAQNKSAPAKQAPAAKQAAPAPAGQPAPPAFKEVALTDKLVEGAIAAQKDMDAIAAKLPQKPSAQPDPKVVAQFEDAARKNGFASFAEYNDVTATIGVVLAGFDPKTKTYIGAEAALRQQIAAMQSDKAIPAKEKKAALDGMNAALKSPPPAIENKANIDLVTKYYDRLAASMQAE